MQHRGLFMIVLSMAACGGGRDDAATTPVATSGLTVVAPSDNPSSPEKVALGRLLFWDPVLSGGRDVACATCHDPAYAYTDARATSVGAGGTGIGPSRVPDPAAPHVTKRNAMTVLNAVFNGVSDADRTASPTAPMFWDDRARSLEAQALGPITGVDEMRGATFTAAEIVPEIVTRLSAIPEYVARFQSAFGKASIDATDVPKAIAAFERTLIDSGSSYDRFVAGDTSALSAAARQGQRDFEDAGCSNCHSGPMFSDYELHRITDDVTPRTADVGAGNGTFRTASLRNVTRTAPYMHDGAFATLDAVFDFYGRVDRRNDPKLRDLRPPRGQDRATIAAFLASLSDGTFDTSIPTSVPSGLARR